MDQRRATIRSTRPDPTGPTQSRAVRARPLRIDSQMSVEDAYRVTLLECLSHVAANVAAVTRGHEAEGLHQLRVGLRRLSVAFSAFGEEFRTPIASELQARGKAFAASVGPARDLDVFADELFTPAIEAIGNGPAFRLLQDRLERVRSEAWDAAADQIAGADFARYLDDVASLAQGRFWLTPRGADLGRRKALLAPVETVAPGVLDAFLLRARKRGRRLDALNQRDTHRLRIALKKLRYASEFYGPLFGRKRPRAYLGTMKVLQDRLGALNDAGQVRTALAQLTSTDTGNARLQADLAFASGLVNGWHCAQAARLRKGTLKRWDAFRRLKPFWL